MDNVIPLKGKVQGSLFSDDLRVQLEASIKPHTATPAEVVSALEQALCSYLVSKAVNIGTRIGERLAKAILSKL